MEEQRVIIKFFTKEGKNAQEIQEILEKHYGEEAYKLPTIYKWIQRFRTGHESVEDEERSGRPNDDQIVNSIQKLLEEDPLCSARSIARQLNVSDWLVRDRLRNNLGYRNLRSKLVPHFLTSEQKSARVRYAKSMLKELEKHIETNFKYVLTGDESWFNFYYDARTQWVIEPEELIQRESPSHFKRKIMIALFLSEEGVKLIIFKDEKESINADYFINNILSNLEIHVSKKSLPII